MNISDITIPKINFDGINRPQWPRDSYLGSLNRFDRSPSINDLILYYDNELASGNLMEYLILAYNHVLPNKSLKKLKSVLSRARPNVVIPSPYRDLTSKPYAVLEMRSRNGLYTYLSKFKYGEIISDGLFKGHGTDVYMDIGYNAVDAYTKIMGMCYHKKIPGLARRHALK